MEKPTIPNNPTLIYDQRVGIVHSAGMEVKNVGVPKKRVFAVANGNVEGSVHLTAAGGANAHEWQYTTDVATFTNRIATATTTVSTTDIAGLKSGSKYAFFHRPIVPGTTTDWEGPLFLVVL